jgi:hypothetical protein
LPSLKSHAVSLISETSEENLVNVYKILSIEILEFFPFTSNIKMAIFSRISYNLDNPNLYLHYTTIFPSFSAVLIRVIQLNPLAETKEVRI